MRFTYRWKTDPDFTGPDGTDNAWESDTHRFPAWVEMHGDGQTGDPNVFVRFEIRDGVPEVVDFRISTQPDGRAVRSADLLNWSLERLAINAFREQAAMIDTNDPRIHWTGGPSSADVAWEVEGDLLDAQASRRGPSDRELMEVAAVYRAAIDGRPTEEVQRAFAYTSRRTAARRVEQARERGFLPKTTPGKKKAD